MILVRLFSTLKKIMCKYVLRVGLFVSDSLGDFICVLVKLGFV